MYTHSRALTSSLSLLAGVTYSSLMTKHLERCLSNDDKTRMNTISPLNSHNKYRLICFDPLTTHTKITQANRSRLNMDCSACFQLEKTQCETQNQTRSIEPLDSAISKLSVRELSHFLNNQMCRLSEHANLPIQTVTPHYHYTQHSHPIHLIWLGKIDKAETYFDAVYQ